MSLRTLTVCISRQFNSYCAGQSANLQGPQKHDWLIRGHLSLDLNHTIIPCMWVYARIRKKRLQGPPYLTTREHHFPFYSFHRARRGYSCTRAVGPYILEPSLLFSALGFWLSIHSTSDCNVLKIYIIRSTPDFPCKSERQRKHAYQSPA